MLSFRKEENGANYKAKCLSREDTVWAQYAGILATQNISPDPHLAYLEAGERQTQIGKSMRAQQSTPSMPHPIVTPTPHPTPPHLPEETDLLGRDKINAYLLRGKPSSVQRGLLADRCVLGRGRTCCLCLRNMCKFNKYVIFLKALHLN